MKTIMTVDEVFALEGPIAGKLEGYIPRPGQIRLANEVDEAQMCGTHLVAEGPTGTGKSLAYLIPSALRAIHEGETTLVATANIALQEQLIKKDLPFITDAIGEFPFALAKGMNNYACLHNIANAKRLDMSPQDGGTFDMITDWVRSTEFGDLSELDFEVRGTLSESVRTTSDDCLRRKCKFYDRCFAIAARERIGQARIIVSNYHLLFAHVSLSVATEGTVGVLPHFSHLVLDEAHKAADIARDFFGMRVSSYRIRRLVRDLEHRDPLRMATIEKSSAVFSRVADLSKQTRYKTRYEGQLPIGPSLDELFDVLAKVRDAYRRGASQAETDSRREELTKRSCDASVIDSELRTLTEATDDSNVYFIDGKGALCSKLIDVAPILEDSLFGDVRSSVTTSATLAVGGSFSHLIEELGVPEASTLEVPSPFDHERQSAIVYPSRGDDIPQTNDPLYVDYVARSIVEVVRSARGRTLCLFTSYRSLEHSYEVLSRAGLPYKIFRQGGGSAGGTPRGLLTKFFREDTSSVLLGTESFWAGVDAPGEALSCVVVDKIPFPMLSDPVLDAMSSRDPKSFFNEMIPRAVIQWRQGVGRLIRRDSDRGVIVMLDPRVTSKGYGRTFLRSLPSMPRISIPEIGAFIDGG